VFPCPGLSALGLAIHFSRLSKYAVTIFVV
jgi:hypothetical protein